MGAKTAIRAMNTAIDFNILRWSVHPHPVTDIAANPLIRNQLFDIIRDDSVAETSGTHDLSVFVRLLILSSSLVI